MIDACDVSERLDPTVAEAEESAVDKRKRFADKLAKRPPPNPIERAEIKKARNAPKPARPRNAINIEDRGAARRSIYADPEKDINTGLPTRSAPVRCNSFMRC